jgi:hypothetical protein
MAAQGFGDMLGAAPELDPLSLRARHCWIFCEGWNPERWPVYDALYPVPDWHQVIDLMTEIRRAL